LVGRDTERSDGQAIRKVVGELTIEANVLSLVVIHLLAREAAASDDAEQWLRKFADEVHTSIDRPLANSTVADSLEMARNRLDQIMTAARLRIIK
jgi:hypothetical protein